MQAVYANHDDDPYALARDARVRGALADTGVALHTGKDHVVFERDEVLTAGGKPYSVFTPYKNAWLKKLDAFYLKAYPVARHAARAGAAAGRPSRPACRRLPAIGFEPTNLHALKLPTGSAGARTLLDDFLAAHRRLRRARATSRPSRGRATWACTCASARCRSAQLAREAWQRTQAGTQRGAQTWLSELIWRDFYHQILHHHPHVVGAGLQARVRRASRWEHGKHADALFAAWCEGRTGYPLVDAAMAQINQTGYMHNRLRMVVASFLCKDLGIDWRRGERYFAEHLNDFDLAANNGGWQWAASTGCDAQP